MKTTNHISLKNEERMKLFKFRRSPQNFLSNIKLPTESIGIPPVSIELAEQIKCKRISYLPRKWLGRSDEFIFKYHLRKLRHVNLFNELFQLLRSSTAFFSKKSHFYISKEKTYSFPAAIRNDIGSGSRHFSRKIFHSSWPMMSCF
jgi:hypothetical protein